MGSLHGFAQTQLSTTNKKAIKWYKKGQDKARERDFVTAIELFQKAITQDAKFYEAYLRKGSLFNAMGMEDSVYSNFTKYLIHSASPSKSVIKLMSFMAFERGEYEFSETLVNQQVNGDSLILIDREMKLLAESLKFAKDQMNEGRKVEITQLPSEINRFKLQYLPAMTIDNSTLIYTKRDRIESDEDIVVSYYENDQWTSAESISLNINTRLNEGACTISADGKLMIFTSCDRRDALGSCDLYYSKRTSRGWTRPKNLGRPVNSHYWESQPSLSADGKTLYFSSNRPGGEGGRDLWVTYKKEKWTKPVNLGSNVNTFRDETTPFIHFNNETLYFSSNGHIGMGGYDLVKSNKLDSVWGKVENLGYPINTNNDEAALLIAGDGKTAYFAQEVQRDYKIIDSKIVKYLLPDSYKTRPASYIVGKTLDKQTGQALKAQIEVVDLNNAKSLYSSESDSITGDYLMVLPADRELVCYAKKKGYLFYENNFFSTSNSPALPDTINIELRPIAIGESIILENIYFEIDSYELGKKSLAELSSVVQILKDNPGISVEIAGHTDNSGTQAYNQQLSESRAKSVYSYLAKRVNKERLSFKGYGFNKPIALNESEDGRKKNRRIEFRILNIK